ncbi:YcaO-like family protein [Streptomyces sp. bgisy084]|uniref:YcaO-like family protein n=1 Tax=unclassified Streptomyces TaxID=2593676 RepID=UPI003D706145
MTTTAGERTVPSAEQPEVAARLEDMVSPFGGLFGAVKRLADMPGEPAMPIFTASLGDPAEVVDGVALWQRRLRQPTANSMDGAGGDLDPRTGRWLSIAEALERYCALVWRPEQIITATAEELGHEAVDLAELPQLSERELAMAGQTLVPPDPAAPRRWVRGIRLRDAKLTWLPAMYVWLCLHAESRAETITHGISTGCAGHTDARTALVKGLCEAVERDAVALVWLQMLSLPRLDCTDAAPELRELLERHEEHPGIRMHLFDATTDIGLPTVYAVRVAQHSTCTHTVVAASTEFDPTRAAVKAIRETISCRLAFEMLPEDSSDVADFQSASAGGQYMAHASRAHAFDFLLNSPHSRPIAHLPRIPAADPAQQLAAVLDRLEAAGFDAYAVDLTTDEAREAGVTVVRTLVPGLQPLSFVQRSRYLGHPRLYDAPRRMGFPVRSEGDINPWPQPFA